LTTPGRNEGKEKEKKKQRTIVETNRENKTNDEHRRTKALLDLPV
jgi:hypothetical protein